MEVLFCYEPYDEVVLMQLREFNDKKIISVEKQMRQNKDSVDFDGSKYWPAVSPPFYSFLFFYCSGHTHTCTRQ